MLRIPAWLFEHYQPQEGWLHFLLAMVSVSCLPLALVWANEDVDAAGLLVLTVVAAALALRSARSRLSSWAVAFLSSISGLTLVAILAGQLVPPFNPPRECVLSETFYTSNDYIRPGVYIV